MLPSFKALLLASFLAFSAPPAPHNITSIQPITTEGGMSFCTAFSVSQEKRLYVTAAHCVEDTPDQYIPFIFSQHVRVVKIDLYHDLALLQAALGTPALQVADQPAGPGEAVSVVGFIGAHDLVSMFNGTFESNAIGMWRDQQIHVFGVYDLRIEPGMSGSPIFGADGKVVSVGQVKFKKRKLTGGVLLEYLRIFLEM